MSRPPILSGYVPTPVPGPTEIPSPVPGSVVVPTEVPIPAVVGTELPGPTIMATELPGPTIVATPLPFWIQQVVGILQAEGQIQVQILGVELDASEALRGRGEIQASVTGIQTGAPTQYLRARGIITALAGMSLPSGLKTLAGRGAVLVQSALMALPGGTKVLGGRGRITATRTGYGLGIGTKTVAGRGAISVTSAGYPAMSPVTTVYNTVGTVEVPAPYWWRYMDLFLIAGGASGQTGNGSNNRAGKGGQAATWYALTIERGVDINAMTPKFEVTVGAGGASPANADFAGPSEGGPSQLRYWDTGLAAWTGFAYAAGASGTASGQNGVSPGNITHQGITRTGGTGGTGNGGSATAPGASGAGGNGGIFGSRTRGGAGARGEVVIRFRQ